MPAASIRLTDQQRAALSARGTSVALSAGAGCGKTFVLTQRFLARLQPGAGENPLAKIVAITFTDRAAREMRDRIRSACQAELRDCPPEEASHWMQIVRGLDSARISTFHSFCGSLLRSHAVDAKVDPRFATLDQTTFAPFLRRVVTESLYDLLSAQDEDAMHLVLHYGLERTRDLLRSLVLDRFRVDFRHFQDATAESLAADWTSRWRERFVPEMLRQLTESDAVAGTLRLLSEHLPTHEEMQRRRQFLLDHLQSLPDCDDPAELLEQLRDCAQIRGGGGKSAWENEDVYDSVRDSLTRVRKSMDAVRKNLQCDLEELTAAVEFGASVLRLVQAVCQHFEQQKQAGGLLDFDDLLLLTRNLLRENESVRARAAAGIDFLMVDEFQDTDPVQTEIVRMLSGEELLTGKLFFVGDAKQSIYRFRRADPAVFAALREELPAAGRLPLNMNFRSQPAILHFVNCLFAPTMGAAYEPLVPADTTQYSPEPAIEYLFAAADADAETERESASDRRRREADWIARRIHQLLHDETPRIRTKNLETGEVELRRLKLGDVTILFRTLSNVAIYEDALRKFGIDYYLVGGRAFYAQQEVYDLVNLLQYLDDRDDQVSLAGVLRSPFFSLNDDTLFALVEQNGTLNAALNARPPTDISAEQQRQVRHAGSVLAELRGLRDRLPLAELLNRVMERTGYDAGLLNEFLGQRKLANLKKLIEMARQFDRAGLSNLKEYVSGLRDAISEEAAEELAATHPETSDVVRLMTVHQSKGLEFPVVVVADMDWTKRGGTTDAHFHPELGPLLPLPALHGKTRKNPGMEMHKLVEDREGELETVRLLYVATTRAADYLILSAGLPPDRKPSSPWLKLLAKRFDLQTGLPAVDPYLGRISLGDIADDGIPTIHVHRSAPEVDKTTRSRTQRELPLEKIREAVEAAEPGPLPESLTRYTANGRSRHWFNVTEIEHADAEIHAVDHDAAVPVEEADDGWLGSSLRAPSERTFRGLRSEDSAPTPATSGNLVEASSSVDATTFGTLVHEVLERIDFAQPDSLEAIIETRLQNVPPAEADGLRKKAVACLRAFLDSPIREELAAAKQCFREIDFLLRWPTGESAKDVVTVSGQIDCLFETADGRWMILDYKTGRVATKSAEYILAEYDLQLGIYALATRELLGELPHAVEIVALEERPRRIPLALSEPILERMSKRITAAINRLRCE